MIDLQMRGNIGTCSHVVYYYQMGMPTAPFSSTHVEAVQYTAHCLIAGVVYRMCSAASGSPAEVQDLVRGWRYGPKGDLPLRP